MNRTGCSPCCPRLNIDRDEYLDSTVLLADLRMDAQPMSAHFRLVFNIGKGSFGGITIMMGKHLPSGRTVAVRVTDLDTCTLPLSVIQYEVEMHRTLRHKNILPVLYSFMSNHQLWIVQPCAAFGSCKDLLNAHFDAGLPELAVAFIVRDVLHALDYLHSRAIIHRCLKASHILIKADGTACLSGLRHCCSMLRGGIRLRVVHDFPERYRNYLLWASPELLEQNLRGYNTLSDIYSLGITICEMANGVVPFQDMQLIQMLLSKVDGVVPRLIDVTSVPELRDKQFESTVDGQPSAKDIAPKYIREFSPDFHEFVEICLRFSAESRKSAAALLTHPFLKQLKKKGKVTSLIQLLKPLNPITCESTKPMTPVAEEELRKLNSGVDDMTMDEVSWTF